MRVAEPASTFLTDPPSLLGAHLLAAQLGDGASQTCECGEERTAEGGPPINRCAGGPPEPAGGLVQLAAAA